MPARSLRWRCDPASFGVASTARVRADDRWIGEPRARASVEMALRSRGPRHHLIVRGPPGSGRHTLLRWVRRRLDDAGELARRPAAGMDRVFVERPEHPGRARLLTLPAGDGAALVEALDALATRLDALAGLPRRDARRQLREALDALPAGDRDVRAHTRRLGAWLRRELAALCDDDDARTDERRRTLARVGGQLLRAGDPGGRSPWISPARLDVRRLFGAIDPGEAGAPPLPAQLHAGALVEADGGVLVLPAEPLLDDPSLLRRLVQTLRRGSLRLAPAPGKVPPALADTRPDPVPLDVRVIVVATPGKRIAPLLEPEVRELFGLLADTTGAVPWDDTLAQRLPGVVARIGRDQGSRAVRARALARLVEEQVRDADGRGRLSPRLARLADRLVEADLHAAADGSRAIRRRHVDAALADRRWRGAGGEALHRERLVTDRLQVAVDGAAVGVANGLLVYTRDGHRYGAPTRITASTAVGRQGVVNVEREAKLSGKTFDKGVFVLVGLLRARFGRRDPLGLVATITCEQNHGRIDGDSASATELAAILSDLADAPIRQGVALTGAVGQRGELQAVGGVNAKVEGFFAACVDRGLTGDQGVILPTANVEDLVLDPALVDEARRGRFHVWAAATIDEALAWMTGLPAGVPDADGRYPAGTLYGRAQRRLDRMSTRLFPPRKSGSGAKKRASSKG